VAVIVHMCDNCGKPIETGKSRRLTIDRRGYTPVMQIGDLCPACIMAVNQALNKALSQASPK
jgi:hypothetical protein